MRKDRKHIYDEILTNSLEQSPNVHVSACSRISENSKAGPRLASWINAENGPQNAISCQFNASHKNSTDENRDQAHIPKKKT